MTSVKKINTLKQHQLKQYVLLEEYTNGIIESIRLGVVVVNNDMLITIINQAAKEVLNINDDYLGKDLHEVFICCDNIKDKIKTAIRHNRIIENSEFVIKKEEKELNIKVSVFPLTFQAISKGAIITIDDITEMKKLQHHIQRNDKLAALGELSTGVAHEIRNLISFRILWGINEFNRNYYYGEMHTGYGYNLNRISNNDMYYMNTNGMNMQGNMNMNGMGMMPMNGMNMQGGMGMKGMGMMGGMKMH